MYFRNRSHDARVAIKRFRYALELAKASGAWQGPGALRAVRKAQSALGEAHDREVLLKRVAKLADDGPADQREVAAIKQLLQGEIFEFHRSYLAERARVSEVAAAACAHTHKLLPIGAGAMAIAAFAVPVVLARRKR